MRKEDTSSDPLIQRNQSIRILAESILRELKSQGYDEKHIVALATELLSEVTGKIRRQSHTAPVSE